MRFLFSVGYKIRFRKVARNCFRSSSGSAAKRCMNCQEPESTDGAGGSIISSPSPFSSHERGTPNVWHICWILDGFIFPVVSQRLYVVCCIPRRAAISACDKPNADRSCFSRSFMVWSPLLCILMQFCYFRKRSFEASRMLSLGKIRGARTISKIS